MRIAALLLSLTLLPQMAFSQEEISEDAAPGIPFKEGDVISFETIDKLKDYLPPEFWEHREYFFYEGMEIEIGPVMRDYAPASAYQDRADPDQNQSRPYDVCKETMNRRLSQRISRTARNPLQPLFRGAPQVLQGVVHAGLQIPYAARPSA